MALTQQQENFAVAYVETGTASEAYRRAYPKSLKWTVESVCNKASEALRHVGISARINELRAIAAKRHAVTVDSLVGELEEARQAALQAETPQASAAVSATLGKAKLCGLDKQVLEHTGNVTFTAIARKIIKPDG